MKYGRILFALTALSLAACAKQNMYGQMDDLSLPVLTTFKKHSTSVNISLKEYLTVGVKSVKKTVLCRNGDDRVFVDVVVPARVSASHIEILASESKTIKYDGDLTCTASIEKSLMAYEIRYGDSMYLTPVDGKKAFYGYRVDRRPQFLERVKRTAVEGYTAVKDVAIDLKDAADDEIAQKVIAYRKGTADTMNTISRGAKMYGDTMYKNGMGMMPGPM